MTHFEFYDSLGTFYAMHYKLYHKYKIHNTNITTWHLALVFVTSVMVYLKLLKVIPTTWFVVFTPVWFYMMFFLLIMASVLVHQLRQAHHALKYCIYMDLANNLFGVLLIAANLILLCFLWDGQGLNLSYYSIFAPYTFYLLLLTASHIGMKKYLSALYYIVQGVWISVFAVLIAVHFSVKKISWFIVLIPVITVEITYLLEKVIEHSRTKRLFETHRTMDLRMLSFSQRMDISLILAIQAPLVLLYMFLGFLFDGERELTISILTTIFVPFQITVVLFFVWLAVKPKLLFFLMQTLQDQDVEGNETINPETVQNLVSDLYRMIQERREQGEVLDSQEVRFIEFLYLMQQHHNAHMEPVSNGVSGDLLQNLPVYEHNEETSDPGTCTICISDFTQGDKVLTLPCAHRFHLECCSTWLSKNKTCPNCNGHVEHQSQYYTTAPETTVETTVEMEPPPPNQ